MKRIPIRSLSDDSVVRVFDLLVENGCVIFQVKTGKNEYRSITLEEFLFQVETAINNSIQKQEGNYPDKPHLPS